MHVKDEPRDEYYGDEHPDGPRDHAESTEHPAAVPAPRSAAEESDEPGISWSREPVETEDRVEEDRVDRDPVDEADGSAVGVAQVPDQEDPADPAAVTPAERHDDPMLQHDVAQDAVQDEPAVRHETASVGAGSDDPASSAPVAEAHDSLGTDRLVDLPDHDGVDAADGLSAPVAPLPEFNAGEGDGLTTDETAAANTANDTPDLAAAPVSPSGELLPGAVADPPAGDTLWSDGDAQGFRDRWREVQLRFVDDPHAAVEEAAGLVGDAINGLTAALSARRDDLAGWQSASSGDTEELRMAVRRYREFLDRVLGL